MQLSEIGAVADDATAEVLVAGGVPREQVKALGFPVSPQFDSHVGWPQQNKLGDYSTILSDATGSDVAYAATFNGEQDIYYMRLFPDCNGNGFSDVTDLAAVEAAFAVAAIQSHKVERDSSTPCRASMASCRCKGK
jgi:hypothetical protein